MGGSNVAEWIAALAAIMTAGIIYNQARLLIQQNQISALIQLQKEWDSERYRILRSRWAANTRDLKAAEPLLEFLEDFAGFRKRNVLDDELIWDTTLGWHAARYYYYNCKNGNLSAIREMWAADHTIFSNLESSLWRAYVQHEMAERRIPESKIKMDFDSTEKTFISAERECYDGSQVRDGED